MRYVAFLRAINVGGRVVRMDALRKHFDRMGHAAVDTFIASGNVIFESSSRSSQRLEQSIEKELHAALGYQVVTFLRSLPELAELVDHPLLASARPADGATLYVVFVRDPVSRTVAQKLLASNSPTDEFHVRQREVLWIRHGLYRESKFAGPLLERTLGQPATMRNSTTVRKIVAKYAAG